MLKNQLPQERARTNSLSLSHSLSLSLTLSPYTSAHPPYTLCIIAIRGEPADCEIVKYSSIIQSAGRTIREWPSSYGIYVHTLQDYMLMTRTLEHMHACTCTRLKNTGVWLLYWQRIQGRVLHTALTPTAPAATPPACLCKQAS